MSKSMIKKILSGATILFAIIAFFMMFAPALSDKVSGEGVQGTDIIFGYKRGSSEMFKFSFANLLPYLLIVGGIVLAVFGALGKEKKLMLYIQPALFFIAGIFLFLVLRLTLSSDVLLDYMSYMGSDDLSDWFRLGAGAIVGGVFCFIASIVSLISIFIKE